jgi:hypothetical protein
VVDVRGRDEPVVADARAAEALDQVDVHRVHLVVAVDVSGQADGNVEGAGGPVGRGGAREDHARTDAP